MGRMEGQAVIVTGSGGGIGRHTALAFAREGASVVIVDVKAEGVDETAHMVESSYGDGRALGLIRDIGSEETVRAIVKACVERFGRLDCVVNNAVHGYGATPEAIEVEPWNQAFAVNVTAPMLFGREALPHLAATPEKTGGSIVNISSIRALRSMPTGMAYDTAKAALLGLTRTQAVEFGQQGVRVNAVLPGHIMSHGEEGWLAHMSEKNAMLMRQPYPLRRVGKPEEIASAVLFFASAEASFITGQCLVVDGGMSVMNPETAVFRAADALQSFSSSP